MSGKAGGDLMTKLKPGERTGKGREKLKNQNNPSAEHNTYFLIFQKNSRAVSRKDRFGNKLYRVSNPGLKIPTSEKFCFYSWGVAERPLERSAYCVLLPPLEKEMKGNKHFFLPRKPATSQSGGRPAGSPGPIRGSGWQHHGRNQKTHHGSAKRANGTTPLAEPNKEVYFHRDRNDKGGCGEKQTNPAVPRAGRSWSKRGANGDRDPIKGRARQDVEPMSDEKMWSAAVGQGRTHGTSETSNKKIRTKKILKKPKQNEKITLPGRFKKTLEKILETGTLGALRFIKKITMLGTLRLIAKKIMKTGTLGALRLITENKEMLELNLARFSRPLRSLI